MNKMTNRKSYFPVSTKGPGSTLYPVAISNLFWINGSAKVPDKCLLRVEVENEMKSRTVTDEPSGTVSFKQIHLQMAF